MQEAVSVIIPAYNASSTIEAAIQSVISGTFQDFTVIVCDDASTDNTPELVRAIGDPRVKLLVNENNVGPGPSRDRAMAASSGKWIAWLDADDAWEPVRLDRLLAEIGASSTTILFDDIMTCHDVNGKLMPWQPIHGQNGFSCKRRASRDFGLVTYLVSPRLLIKPLIPAQLIRSAALKHSNRKFGEDTEFFIRLAAAGGRFRYMPEPMYLYRVTPGSATGRNNDHGAMRRMIQECRDERIWPDEVVKAFEKKTARLWADECIYRAVDEIKQGRLLGAARNLLSHPSAVTALPARAWRRFDYEWSRHCVRGAKR